MFDFIETSKTISDIQSKVGNALLRNNLAHLYHPSNEKSDSVRLVFAGQYSAGKSSILQMLTGDHSIAVGEGITTQQCHSYEWNGIHVVDTPGIHTELRPDHDEISYQEIANADMLVFVVTSQLFDSYMASHFRKLAIDHDKAAEMILVVNKMMDTADGNTPQQQAILLEDLKRVIAPYTPEQLHICFLDAKSYLDGLEEQNEDPELAKELIARSGYTSFIHTLSQFVKDKKLSGKLTTELYRIEDAVQKAIKELEPSSSDVDIDALEEQYYQQRFMLSEARERLRLELRGVFDDAAADIRDYGLEAANLLVPGAKQEDVEQKLSEFIKSAERRCEDCQSQAQRVFEERLHEIEQDIERLENSDFAIRLKIRLQQKQNTLPKNIAQLLKKAGEGAKRAGDHVVKAAYNAEAAATGGIRLANFSGSTVHETVLKVGHFFGHKFKPWEAIKWARGVAIGAQVLAGLGVVFSVFMQVKSDNDEEERIEEQKENRQKVRAEFNKAASELEAFGKEFIAECLELSLDKSISEINHNILEIQNTKTGKSNACKEMHDLLVQCQSLIYKIHAEA